MSPCNDDKDATPGSLLENESAIGYVGLSYNDSSDEELHPMASQMPVIDSTGSDTLPCEVIRAKPKERFICWCNANKEWIDIAVDLALKGTIMHRILKMLKAPYGWWVTVKNNVVKYSGLKTVDYVCSRGHMFLGSLFNPETVQNLQESCSVCMEKGTDPDLCSFEYIPILPRVREWVKNEQIARDLFDYREEELQRKRQEQTEDIGDDGEKKLYRDYFDGTLYSSLLHDNCNVEPSKYDIILAVSSDGFQTYNNRDYDC